MRAKHQFSLHNLGRYRNIIPTQTWNGSEPITPARNQNGPPANSPITVRASTTTISRKNTPACTHVRCPVTENATTHPAIPAATINNRNAKSFPGKYAPGTTRSATK